MTDKPRFYLQDLDNYNEDFLKEIILWYDEELKRVQDSIKLTKTNQESEKFLKDENMNIFPIEYLMKAMLCKKYFNFPRQIQENEFSVLQEDSGDEYGERAFSLYYYTTMKPKNFYGWAKRKFGNITFYIHLFTIRTLMF